MKSLKERIEEAMRRNPNVSQADIARACKVKSPSVADWLNGKTKSLKPEPARLAAALFGCDQNWIGQGVGQPNWKTTIWQSPKGGPHVEGAGSEGALDHLLSQVKPMVEPRTVIWETILTETLPSQFKLALPDDALAPAYPTGSLFIWSTTKAPRVGSVVLVRDSFGQPHARRYGQGRAPGQWVAEATGPGFVPFDGAAVTLLAVAEEERRPMP